MLRKAGLVIQCHSQSVSECQSAFIQKMPDSTLIIFFFLFYLHLFIPIPWQSQILKTGYWKIWPSGWKLTLARDLCVPEVRKVQILEHFRVDWNLFNIIWSWWFGWVFEWWKWQLIYFLNTLWGLCFEALIMFIMFNASIILKHTSRWTVTLFVLEGAS